MSTSSKFNMNIIYIALAILVGILVIWQVERDNGKTGLDKAADNISSGIHDAAGSLDNRGPVEKVGDALKDATN